jgi:hypothetical protein
LCFRLTFVRPSSFWKGCCRNITQEVAMENEQLKQEVACLTKDLTQVKGKMEQA